MTVDPAVTVTSVAAGVSATQPYTSPTTAERVDAGIGLARLAIGDLAGAAELLGPLGFTITTDLDPATGRRYAMAVSETTTPRAWGLYLVDLSQPLGLCIAVPHPKSDANCEQLALRLWRATTRLDAGHGGGSPRRRVRNRRPLPEHRLGVPPPLDHRDRSAWRAAGPDPRLRERHAPPSRSSSPPAPDPSPRPRSGSPTRSPRPGWYTTRSWDGTANPNLDATTNEQGIAADTNGWVWVHVEHNRTVRDDDHAVAARDRRDRRGEPRCSPTTDPRPAGRGTSRNRSAPRTPPAPRGSSPARTMHTAAQPSTHHHPQPVVRFAPFTLTDAPTITIDASRGDYFRVGLLGNRTLAAPTNGADGQRVLIEALASGAQRTLAFELVDPAHDRRPARSPSRPASGGSAAGVRRGPRLGGPRLDRANLTSPWGFSVSASWVTRYGADAVESRVHPVLRQQSEKPGGVGARCCAGIDSCSTCFTVMRRG